MHELSEKITAEHNVWANLAISVRYIGNRIKQTARGCLNITVLAEVNIYFSEIILWFCTCELWPEINRHIYFDTLAAGRSSYQHS